MEGQKTKSVTSGAIKLGLGAFIAKVLGAIYRVPLTNMLGGEGLGLYQMVFPIYTLLLDFSGAGVPSAISKIIASNKDEEGNNAQFYLKSSLILLFFLGVFASIIMATASRVISVAQGNSNASAAYITLAPAIFFVCIISCFRGYYQGLMNMTPTAVSQVIEQAVKLVLGLIFVRILLPNIPLAVAGATLAITISEIFATLYFIIIYKKDNGNLPLKFKIKDEEHKKRIKTIIKTTIPITLIGITIPLSQVIDSFLVVNILSSFRTDATSLYGLLCGAVCTVINLPVSVCYGIATVAIPTVSKAKDKTQEQRSIKKVIALTLLISIPCVIICNLFSPFIVKLLFSGLNSNEKITTINLLKVCSINILFLSMLQTLNGILIGKGKLYKPLISMGIGVIVKVILNLLLLNVKRLNIFGGAIAVIACYFVACLINLIMIFSKRKGYADKKSKNWESTDPK